MPPGRSDVSDRPDRDNGPRPGSRAAQGFRIRASSPRCDEPTWLTQRYANAHWLSASSVSSRAARGRSYGPPLPPGVTEDDGAAHGLIFVCFNASIWRQIETVQALWIDDGEPFDLGPDKGFLVGEPHGTRGKMTIQGHPPFFLKPQPRFVTIRGGEYLYRPSMTGLRRLAAIA